VGTPNADGAVLKGNRLIHGKQLRQGTHERRKRKKVPWIGSKKFIWGGTHNCGGGKGGVNKTFTAKGEGHPKRKGVRRKERQTTGRPRMQELPGLPALNGRKTRFEEVLKKNGKLG